MRLLLASAARGCTKTSALRNFGTSILGKRGRRGARLGQWFGMFPSCGVEGCDEFREGTQSLLGKSAPAERSKNEGYIDGLNAEAASTVNTVGVAAARLPEQLRLLHSRASVETIADTNWELSTRAAHLTRFVETEGWLWGSGPPGSLDPDRLLTWMKSPHPANLKRYFRFWGIEDVFARITRAGHTRAELWRRLAELVDKRNAVAHGDLGTTATTSEIRLYLRVVNRFASRADGVLSAHLGRLCDCARPW